MFITFCFHLSCSLFKDAQEKTTEKWDISVKKAYHKTSVGVLFSEFAWNRPRFCGELVFFFFFSSRFLFLGKIAVDTGCQSEHRSHHDWVDNLLVILAELENITLFLNGIRIVVLWNRFSYHLSQAENGYSHAQSAVWQIMLCFSLRILNTLWDNCKVNGWKQ